MCIDSPVPITGDFTFEATVTANDLRDEFYKTLLVNDGSGGIEIAIDSRQLFRSIPLHARVIISCNGLALGRSGQKIVLGMMPQSEYSTDRIPYNDIQRYINLTGQSASPDPLELTVAEISVQHISQFVYIKGLHLIEEERQSSWCDPIGDQPEDEDDDRFLTYSDRHFIDDRGDTLTVRTLNRCNYRHEPIPEGRIALAGAIDWADDRYVLRIVDHYIVKM